MKKSEFLKAAWSRISNPRHWIQGAYHRADWEGEKYCMVGALEAELHDRVGQPMADRNEVIGVFHAVYDDLALDLGCGVEDYNDSHTWRDLRARVLAMIQRWELQEQPEIKVEPLPDLKVQKPKVVRVQATKQEKQAEKELA